MTLWMSGKSARDCARVDSRECGEERVRELLQTRNIGRVASFEGLPVPFRCSLSSGCSYLQHWIYFRCQKLKKNGEEKEKLESIEIFREPGKKKARRCAKAALYRGTLACWHVRFTNGKPDAKPHTTWSAVCGHYPRLDMLHLFCCILLLGTQFANACVRGCIWSSRRREMMTDGSRVACIVSSHGVM